MNRSTRESEFRNLAARCAGFATALMLATFAWMPAGAQAETFATGSNHTCARTGSGGVEIDQVIQAMGALTVVVPAAIAGRRD